MTDHDWPREPKRAADHDPLCHAAAIDYHDPECCDCALIDKVRADERDATIASLVPGLSAGAHAIGDLLTRQSLADLRAKVEDLPPAHRFACVWLDDVLALFDGGSE